MKCIEPAVQPSRSRGTAYRHEPRSYRLSRKEEEDSRVFTVLSSAASNEHSAGSQAPAGIREGECRAMKHVFRALGGVGRSRPRRSLLCHIRWLSAAAGP